MKKKNNKMPLLIVGVLLLVALPLSVVAVQNQTFTRQEAAEEVDINSATEIAATNNVDGTMGPKSANENFSTQVTASEKGKLDVELTDFFKANGQGTDEEETDGTTRGKDKEHKNKGKKNLEFTAINITISKAEVHLAKLASELENEENEGTEEETSQEQTSNENLPNTERKSNSGKGKGKVKGDSTESAKLENEKRGHWETLDIEAPLTLDLVQLATDGNITPLGLTELAAGKYTQIRLYVSSASATLADGSTVELDIPGKNNVVRIVKPFTIQAGETTTLLISVNSKKSIIKAGNKYKLKPVVARILVKEPEDAEEEQATPEE